MTSVQSRVNVKVDTAIWTCTFLVVEEVQEHSRSISNEKMSQLKKKLHALKKTLIRDSIAIKGHHTFIVG